MYTSSSNNNHHLYHTTTTTTSSDTYGPPSMSTNNGTHLTTNHPPPPPSSTNPPRHHYDSSVSNNSNRNHTHAYTHSHNPHHSMSHSHHEGLLGNTTTNSRNQQQQQHSGRHHHIPSISTTTNTANNTTLHYGTSPSSGGGSVSGLAGLTGLHPSHDGQTPDQNHETVEMRRERNRIAARKSRQRKVHRVQCLEEEKELLEQRHDALTKETLELQSVLHSTMTMGEPTTLSEEQAEALHATRLEILTNISTQYTSGKIAEIVHVFHPDFVLYGPQSLAQLRGPLALASDYAVTCHLYDNIAFSFSNIESDGVRSKHYRMGWEFSGTIKRTGVSHSQEFMALVGAHVGKHVSFRGVCTTSFCHDQLIFMHRSADQSQYLTALLR